MQWIQDFNLFLFDFDGLLINSELVHFKAYALMCAAHGCQLDWDFERYCQTAHYKGEGLKTELFALFPALEAYDPSWKLLYEEKQKNVRDLFHRGEAQLMPGVEKFLTILQSQNKTCCVVTHSPESLVGIVREQYPVLKAIKHWITREHYAKPKPDPESYNLAIQTLARPSDKVIGFEDTPRGLQALLGTRAKPVLISNMSYPEIPQFLDQGVEHYRTFHDFLDKVKDL